MPQDFSSLRAELSDFYINQLPSLEKQCKAHIKEVLDQKISSQLSAFSQKGLQYGLIAEEVMPTLFRNTDFYYEICGNSAHETPHTPGAWTYEKNLAKYFEIGKEFMAEKTDCESFPIYTYCGKFGDEAYHFALDEQSVLEKGCAGLYQEIQKRMQSEDAKTGDIRAFLQSAAEGLLALRRIADRFAQLAEQKAATAINQAEKEHYLKIAKTAHRIPWEAPQTFYEAIEAIVFLQQVVPVLEGALLCTVGRLDQLLWRFYENDLQNGILSEEEAYRLISEFLLLFDMRIDHDAPNQNDSLVACVYTLGGCDEQGNPVYNALTKLFLLANSEQDIIYPKIKCRFSASSPKEYLDLINRDIIKGKTTVIYVNDDALIPAFCRAGISETDARDYSLLGCWEPVIPGCSNEHCAYMSAIKIFELSLYGGFRKEGYTVQIHPIDNAQSFDEVLQLTLQNIESAMDSRCRIANAMRPHWKEIDPHSLLSATFSDCIAKGRDLTDGGTRYYLDEIILHGLPNVLDSFLVIKELCFEKKVCSLSSLLDAVRKNWQDELLRRTALRCHFYGDDTEESKQLTHYVTDQLSRYAETIPTIWNGRVTLGYMLFMEVYRWAPNLRATPDGRKNGDLYARGLTPSSLHTIPSVTEVVNSYAAIDASGIAADSVLNITVPFGNMPPEILEQFLRVAAQSSVQALQLNCATREELEDAKKHPEKHQNLVVRVCGYSAKFTSLPEYVQNDFMQRNFFIK